MFQKLLIANRGEIACRITRTAHRLGISVVAVHSDVDRNSLHVALADQAIEIGGARPSQSYLNADKIIESALKVGADAIHPGYGFLSENSTLVEYCAKNSIEFIGPSPQAIEVMASKSRAGAIAERVGVPVLSGYRDASQNPASMLEAAHAIGFPVLLKSSAGGGGRGMRIVYSEDQFEELLTSAKSEAKEAFDDDLMIIEKFVESARHIEVQIVGDKHGNIVHLFDRECSAQRRYQKVIEEAPAPNIDSKTRLKMYEAAVALASELNYHSVGTVEFLLDGDEFYFMEMNTRLQVEHPVTEQVTDTDLVEWQLRIADDQSIESFRRHKSPVGHSVEVRLYAENPSKNFLPSPGKIRHLKFPEVDESVQVHTGVRQGDDVDRHYDPLIAKIVTYKPDRAAAVNCMIDALNGLQIVGLETNLEFLSNLLSHEKFQEGAIDVRFIENNLEELIQASEGLPDECFILIALFANASSDATKRANHALSSPWQQNNGWRLNSSRELTWSFACDGNVSNVSLRFQNNEVSAQCGVRTYSCDDWNINGNQISGKIDGTDWKISIDWLDDAIVVCHQFRCYEIHKTEKISMSSASTIDNGSLAAPLSGRVVRVLVEEGEAVKKGQNLIAIEAMKMEHHISSPVDGLVTAINFKENDQVEEGAICVSVDSADSQ